MTRRGNCYVTCEALFHLLGGRFSHLTPHTVRHQGAVHWYLVLDIHRARHADDGEDVSVIIDPTASQFKTRPPYEFGRGRGFLTKGPSKRARALMEQMVWQPVKASRMPRPGSPGRRKARAAR